MQTAIYQKIRAASEKRIKQLAVLVDPDKTDIHELESLINLININSIDYVMVGGSLITGNFMNECIRLLKETTHTPVLIFPGNTLQINPNADGILLLSLISGRNPELLIGNHVIAAPVLKNSGLEILSTGYMLIESGKLTSVEYMSNTTPIPHDKVDIAVCTSVAGEMLGMKLIYMDAGSGAKRPVSEKMIRCVKSSISIPLIVGGGIRSALGARIAWQAGADIVVVGNALEKYPGLLEELSQERDIANKQSVNVKRLS